MEVLMSKTILWRRIDLPGHEACRMFQLDGEDGFVTRYPGLWEVEK